DRQGKYYGDASNYLQLTKEVATNTIALTSRGKDFLQQTPKNQTLLLIQAISEHPIFYQVLQLSLSAGHPLSKKEICKIMLHATETQQYQNSTIERRSSTVYSWILWIFEQMNGSLFDQIA
ncbi:DUF7226 domain-containing protein, partial [Entomospira culicis]|nr:translation elongation factor [Entomospira culicis]